MFTNFFLELRQAKVPVSIKEYLALMEAMEKGVSDYKVDDFYSGECDTGIVWNDPDIAIEWPIDAVPHLSPKDSALPRLAALDVEFEYDGEPLDELRQIDT